MWLALCGWLFSPCSVGWVAVKELKLRYYCNKETLSFIVYPYYGNLIEVPLQQPSRAQSPCHVLEATALREVVAGLDFNLSAF